MQFVHMLKNVYRQLKHHTAVILLFSSNFSFASHNNRAYFGWIEFKISRRIYDNTMAGSKECVQQKRKI